MMRSRTTESLVSTLVILLVALVLMLARATAHGCSSAGAATTGDASRACDRSVVSASAGGEPLSRATWVWP